MEWVDKVMSDREVTKELASQMTKEIFAIGMGVLLLGVDRLIAPLKQNRNSNSELNFKKDIGKWPHQFKFPNLISSSKLQNTEGNI